MTRTYRTLFVFILLIALQSCSGCHNTRIEEAGKYYQNVQSADSANKELQRMEEEKEELKLPEVLQGYWILTTSDSMDSHMPRVIMKSIEFKADSVFGYYKNKTYKGTWKYEGDSLKIEIKGQINSTIPFLVSIMADFVLD